jgi:hypothetical protein
MLIGNPAAGNGAEQNISSNRELFWAGLRGVSTAKMLVE